MLLRKLPLLVYEEVEVAKIGASGDECESEEIAMTRVLSMVVMLMLVNEKPEFKIMLNHLARWWELSESFAEIEDSVF